MESFNLYTDGGARGNPGPAGIGVVIKDNSGTTIGDYNRYIGTSTNNEAEYTALVAGLTLAIKNNIKNLVCSLDSELVVKQLNGEYRVKNENLKRFYDKAKLLEKDFESLVYKHIPRKENSEADALVNLAIDEATRS